VKSPWPPFERGYKPPPFSKGDSRGICAPISDLGEGVRLKIHPGLRSPLSRGDGFTPEFAPYLIRGGNYLIAIRVQRSSKTID